MKNVFFLQKNNNFHKKSLENFNFFQLLKTPPIHANFVLNSNRYCIKQKFQP